MREPRILVEAPLAAGARIPLPEGAFRHVVQVLRLGAGAPLAVFDGRGREFRARLDAVGKRDATVLLEEERAAAAESPLHVTLAQAISKGDRMDYTLQKAVELGVSAIQPLVTARSVVRLDAERQDKKREHWQGVIASACEQSGRALLPELRPAVAFDAWLREPADGALRLTLDPRAADGLRDLPRAERILLLVGPEGGLADEEIAAALQAGFAGVRLGPRVLRTETAGVAALAALQTLWGDLG